MFINKKVKWETPKTNWHYKNESDRYTGDRFSADDFNRIKNNIQYLRKMAADMYNDVDNVSLGKDRTYADYFYADEINRLVENLNIIKKKSFRGKPIDIQTYKENGSIMNCEELNKIEQCTLDLYNSLIGQYFGRIKFKLKFGASRGDF